MGSVLHWTDRLPTRPSETGLGPKAQQALSEAPVSLGEPLQKETTFLVPTTAVADPEVCFYAHGPVIPEFSVDEGVDQATAARAIQS